MADVILHHYPLSPVAEKVRIALGMKGLAWKSVEHNRMPDRPELLAMNGGYRRIPVMQIGANIYCDSHLILRELERRFPEPTFFPGPGKGMPLAVSRWTDVIMFDLLFRVAFAPVMDSLPPALVTDRSRLYLGPQPDMARELADLPHTLAQVRAQLGFLETQLDSGKRFLTADVPGVADACVWYLVWFIRARYPQQAEFMAEFTNLAAWEERMKQIGHGSPSPMTPAEALAVANATEPVAEEKADPRDCQGLKPGMMVAISQARDSGDAPVTGKVHAVDRDRIVIMREAPECGRTAVHFPRVGIRVTIV